MTVADRHRSAADVERLTEAVRADPGRMPDLVALLAEDAPVHRGRTARETARLRARILAVLADVGVPAEALPYVVEDLETAEEPVLVAAAARAARDRDAVPAAALTAALWNVAGQDDVVSLASARPVWPPVEPTTALDELVTTLAGRTVDAGVAAELARFEDARGHLLPDGVRRELGAIRAAARPSPCCAHREPDVPLDDGRRGAPGALPAGIVVEDQDGDRLALAGFVARAPTVVASFYTRCSNPMKCSLTITRLGVLAAEAPFRTAPPRAQVAAVTYDPGYDDPARLRDYCAARGLRFGDGVRAFRAVAGDDALRGHLASRVGYSGSVVNRHAVELHLVGRDGRVTHTWARRAWDPSDVMDAVVALLSPA